MLSFENLAQELAPLLEDPQRVREIGEAQRAWATEYYSSKLIAALIFKAMGL